MEKLKVPIKVGQKLNLNIKDITSTGEGVGKVDNFTVFYTVKDNVMEVRRILYSKRNFNKLI